MSTLLLHAILNMSRDLRIAIHIRIKTNTTYSDNKRFKCGMCMNLLCSHISVMMGKFVKKIETHERTYHFMKLTR